MELRRDSVAALDGKIDEGEHREGVDDGGTDHDYNDGAGDSNDGSSTSKKVRFSL